MIGRLQGILVKKQPPWLLVDVNGVGYELEAPMSTFYSLPAVGEKISLSTHLAVRDDAHLLYGFGSETERTMFRALIKVNGIGAKVALTILSGISSTEFARCVQEDDTASLVKLPGIGKKTAERLIIEMRDRLDDWGGSSDSFLPDMSTGKPAEVNSGSPEREAIAALVALGYKPAEASRMINKIESKDLATEEIIREALKGVVA